MTMFSDGPRFMDDVGEAIEDSLDRVATWWAVSGRGWRRVQRTMAGIALAFAGKVSTRRPKRNASGDPTASTGNITDPGLIGFLRALARATARIDHDAEIRRGETE